MTATTDLQDTTSIDASAVSDAQTTQTTAASTDPSISADKRAPFEALLNSIRAASAADASADVRAAGAATCRAILAALEAQPGQLLAEPPHPPAAAISPLAKALSQLASMSREQILEYLRNQFPLSAPSTATKRTASPRPAAPRFHLIQIPQLPRPGGGS